MATQFQQHETVTDARLGEVKVLEAFDATENSPEQYIVLTAGGEICRTTLSAQGAQGAEAEAQTETPATPATPAVSDAPAPAPVASESESEPARDGQES